MGTATMKFGEGIISSGSVETISDNINYSLHNSGSVKLASENDGNLKLRIESGGQAKIELASQSDSKESKIHFERYRAANSAVQSGDILGNQVFYGYDGSSLKNAASILAKVDGTPGASDMPGSLIFNTSQDGTTTLSERMVIKNDGKIGIATDSPLFQLTISGSGNLGVIDSGSPDIFMSKMNNSVTSGNGIGSIHFQGLNSVGSNIGVGTSISAKAAGNWASVAHAPSNLLFATSEDTVANSTRLIISASGEVGIGTESPKALLDITGSDANLFLANNTGPTLQIARTDDTVVDNNGLGTILFGNYNSALALKQAATIHAKAAADWSGLSQGPTDLQFAVANESSTPQTKLIISSSGNIEIASSISRIGDEDTKIEYSTDRIDLSAGGLKILSIVESAGEDAAVVNADGNQIDFRVAGENTNNLIKTFAQHDAIALNSATIPGSDIFLYVSGAIDASSGKSTFGGDLHVSGSAQINTVTVTSAGRVGIGTASPDAILEVVNDNINKAAVQLTQTEDSNSAGPILELKRNSSSPASADYLGQLKFQGENDANQQVTYAKVTAKILSPTDGNEQGILEFANMKNGSTGITARLRHDSLQLLNATSLVVNGNTELEGGLIKSSIRDVNSNTVATDTDYILRCIHNSPITITLPSKGGNAGQELIIKDALGNAGAHTITIDGAGTDTIDGVPSQTISGDFKFLTLVCDGINGWMIVAKA